MTTRYLSVCFNSLPTFGHTFISFLIVTNHCRLTIKDKKRNWYEYMSCIVFPVFNFTWISSFVTYLFHVQGKNYCAKIVFVAGLFGLWISLQSQISIHLQLRPLAFGLSKSLQHIRTTEIKEKSRNCPMVN